MPDPSDPTTAEWVAASVAAGLVAVVWALHLLRPVLRRSSATPWSRAAGLLLTVLAMGFLLCAGLALATTTVAPDADGEVAGGEVPEGPFASVLVHDDPDFAGHIGGYVAAVLAPSAVVLAVLGLGVAAVGRSSGFRAVAGGACGAVLGVAWLVASGDAGSPAHGLALASLVHGAGAAAALLADEVAARRR